MSKNQNQQPSAEKSPEITEKELSAVASNPKRNIVIIIGICLVFIYLFFNLFVKSDNDAPKAEIVPEAKEIVKPVQVSAENDIPDIPSLPLPPKLEDPTPPPPLELETLPSSIEPPLPVTPLSTDAYSSANQVTLPMGSAPDEESKKRQEAKRKSGIILVSGKEPSKTPEQIQQETDFTYRGNMNLVLGKGKLLEAVVETSINTDFGGEIRAVINRDIYSEWGRNILIPKGSRVFGTYSTGINGSYGRVLVEWNRIDLASGYALNLSGTGVDNLGKKGLAGEVDNKFTERFAQAVLRSAFDVALARTLDSLVKPPIASQATANNNLISSNIKQIASSIFTQSGKSDTQKRVEICASVLSSIQDKTSSAFTQVQSACNNMAVDPHATEAAKLANIVNIVNSSADSLLQSTTASSQETKAQKASTQAFEDISDTVKSFVKEQELKPTVTIDQGTVIKIYVNKDYKFPKAALKKYQG